MTSARRPLGTVEGDAEALGGRLSPGHFTQGHLQPPQPSTRRTPSSNRRVAISPPLKNAGFDSGNSRAATSVSTMVYRPRRPAPLSLRSRSPIPVITMAGIRTRAEPGDNPTYIPQFDRQRF